MVVTVGAASGVLAVNFGVRLAWGDTDAIGYLQRLFGTIVGAGAISGPLALFYCLAVALTAGGINRVKWWAGALAGGLPALIFALILTQGVGSSAYRGSPEELDTLVRQSYLAAALVIVWATGIGAVLIGPLLRSPVTERLRK